MMHYSLENTLLRSRNGQIGGAGVIRQWRIQISNKGDSPRGAHRQKGAFVRSNKQVILPIYLGGVSPRGICVGSIYISPCHIISPNVSPSEIKERRIVELSLLKDMYQSMLLVIQFRMSKI